MILQLGLEKTVVFQKSFNRENIAYFVLEAEDKLFRMEQILKKNPEPSIIYVRNRKSFINLFKITYFNDIFVIYKFFE